MCYRSQVAGDQYTQEAIDDDEGEDDGCDGSTRNGVARVLQITLNIQKHNNTFYLRNPTQQGEKVKKKLN